MDMAASSSSSSLPHVVIFPFMSKGHTIPLIHLADLLHGRRLATVTFLTTPLNSAFIRRSLAGTEVADVVELPFPDVDLPAELPAGIESTDQLPSMSLFLPFVRATKLLRPHFDRALQSQLLPRPSFLISDGFHGWTVDSASKLGIPRLAFYGTGNYAMTLSALVSFCRPHAGVVSELEPFPVPGFPTIQLTRGDLEPPFDDPNPQGPLHEFVSEQAKATSESHGIVVNSFYEMEAPFADHWNDRIGPKPWCVGPLCLAKPTQTGSLHPELVRWLDARSAANRPVLYVAFGSQAEMSAPLVEETAAGLEKSGLDFLWVLRSKEEGSPDVGGGLEERAARRGLVVREWVAQTEILGHRAVRGFLSHCGWNSVLESICAGVPILAWPLMAEQRLNAKMVVEELGIGLRIRSCDGTRNGFVRRESVEELARELLVGEKGKAAAERAAELGGAARKSMGEGGSSWRTLESMVDEVVRVGRKDEPGQKNGLVRSAPTSPIAVGATSRSNSSRTCI